MQICSENVFREFISCCRRIGFTERYVVCVKFSRIDGAFANPGRNFFFFEFFSLHGDIVVSGYKGLRAFYNM